MAETRAPLRQARIFFLYPSSIAGAGLGSYVSLLRAIGQDDLFKDLGNLAVNFGVIAVAIFLLRADLQGRDKDLEEISIELGELEGPLVDPNGGDDGSD